jgi:hypothetical protein
LILVNARNVLDVLPHSLAVSHKAFNCLSFIFPVEEFSKFAARVEGRLHDATVELLAAPFEGGFFEKAHDLGLRRITLLLRELEAM